MMLAAVVSGAVEIYERKVLFSVRYGSAADEIKLAEDESAVLRGPSTLAINPKGEILIGSRGTRLVKKFSPEGKLEAMVACDAWHLEADPEGGFYALADYRTEDGEHRGLKVAHYDSRGKLLYSLFPDFFRAVLKEDRDEADWPKGIQTDSAGNLYCLFRSRTVRLSPAGKLLGTVPSPFYNAKQESYAFTPAFGAPGERISASRLSPTGSEIGKLKIKILPPQMKKGEQLFLSFYEEDLATKGLAVNTVDDAGNIYLAGAIETREPVLLMGGSLQIPGRHVIQKYSPDGKLLAELQFMAEPAGEFPSFEITRKGEIYQLDYRADHLEVVRWAPRTPRKTTEQSREGLKGNRD